MKHINGRKRVSFLLKHNRERTVFIKQEPYNRWAFVCFRLSNVLRHHWSCLMDADGGSVWHYGHSSACFRGAGHVVCRNRPHSTPLMWPRPPSQLGGAPGTVRSGETECQFSPPVNTSQHALIPPSPKVTLSGLQLANSQISPTPFWASFFPILIWSSMAGLRPAHRGPSWDWASIFAPGFHGEVSAQPHGPSSFTVTKLERKRSKQTCGGRECLTWWIAVISIQLPSICWDWWRLLWGTVWQDIPSHVCNLKTETRLIQAEPQLSTFCGPPIPERHKVWTVLRCPP